MLIGFCGKKGAGKSRAARAVAGRVWRERPGSTLLVHDPGMSFNHPSALVVHTVAQAKEWVRLKRQLPRIVVVRRDDPTKLLDWGNAMGDVLYLVDEFDKLCNGKNWRSQSAYDAVHYGRALRVSLLGTFRRTATVAEDFLSQADAMFIFRHSSAAPRDLGALEERFGKAVAAASLELEEKRFLLWRDQ